MKEKERSIFICSGNEEFLSDACRKVEESVKSFLNLGYELHGSTIIIFTEAKKYFMLPSRPARFYVAQAVVRK